MEDNRQLLVDAINEFISIFFIINSNCQIDKCSVHEILRDVPEKVNHQENDFIKIVAFKKLCKDIIVIFSVIENFLSNKKFCKY